MTQLLDDPMGTPDSLARARPTGSLQATVGEHTPSPFAPPSVRVVSLLRCVVCLSIVFYHSYPAAFDDWWFDAGELPSARWFVTHVRFGYTCFFVLAGYFLAHSFRAVESYLSVPGYMTRRILRLAIPYWVALFVVVFGSNLLADLYRGRDRLESYWAAWPTVLFLQDVVSGSDNGHETLWFMAPLMQFYVIWCGAFWVIRRWQIHQGADDHHQRSMAVMHALTAAVFLASIGVAAFFPKGQWSLAREAHYLALGCAIYWAGAGAISPRWVVVAIAAEVLLGFYSGLGRSVAAALMGAILILAARRTLPARRLFSVAETLGVFSFSIYLTHGSIGPRVANLIAGPPTASPTPLVAFAGMMGAVLASIAFGALFFAIVERPTIAGIKHVHYRV